MFKNGPLKIAPQGALSVIEVNWMLGKQECKLSMARFILKQVSILVPILSKTLCIGVTYSANIRQNF